MDALSDESKKKRPGFGVRKSVSRFYRPEFAIGRIGGTLPVSAATETANPNRKGNPVENIEFVLRDVTDGDVFEVDAADLVAIGGAAVTLQSEYDGVYPQLRFWGGTLVLGVAWEGTDAEGASYENWDHVYREGDGEECWTFAGAGRRFHTPADALRTMIKAIRG